MADVRIGFCVHACFADEFFVANSDALRDLAQHLAIEVAVSGSPGQSPATGGVPVCAIPALQLDYNAAQLAALRHTQASFAMWCDASDRIQPHSIVKAASLLENNAEISAAVGGMSRLEAGFPGMMSPRGMLLRRQAGLRFVRVTEDGLVGNYETLAQLRHAGPLSFQTEPLSAKARIEPGAYWHMRLRDAVFEKSRPERYVGQLRLYDPLTMERYLADAEHFIAQQHDADSAGRRRERITAKQAALYGAAARQAAADGEATSALHFFTRELVAWAALGGDRARPLPGDVDIEQLLTKALAEQVAYLAVISATSRILIEDHPKTKALASFLPASAAVWSGEPAAADLSSTLFVFATDLSRAAFRRARRSSACFTVSLDRLADLLASPLAGLRR